MFKDSLQERLKEMEEISPSPSLQNTYLSIDEHIHFLLRHLKGNVRKKSDRLDFSRARWDESYRQIFLDGIDFEGFAPYVSRVIYRRRRPVFNFIREAEGSFFGNTLMSHSSSRIFVYPDSFNPEYTSSLEDFTSMLVGHEGYHAMFSQLYGRKTLKYFLDLIISVTQPSLKQYTKRFVLPRLAEEIYAYNSELEYGELRGTSNQHRQRTIKIRNTYYSLFKTAFEDVKSE